MSLLLLNHARLPNQSQVKVCLELVYGTFFLLIFISFVLLCPPPPCIFLISSRDCSNKPIFYSVQLVKIRLGWGKGFEIYIYFYLFFLGGEGWLA